MATEDEKLALIMGGFELKGEEVIRKSTGRAIKVSTTRPVTPVEVKRIRGGTRIVVGYHRLKFALAEGFLPAEVDHKDRDCFNNRLTNLRPAGRHLQGHNRKMPRKEPLPRGVYRADKGFVAKLTVKSQCIYLGYYQGQEEASKAVEAKLQEIYGDDYSPAA